MGSQTQWFLNAARGCPSSLGDFEMQPGLRFPALPTLHSACLSLLLQLLHLTCVFLRDNHVLRQASPNLSLHMSPGWLSQTGTVLLPSRSQFSVSTVRIFYLDVSPFLHMQHAPHRAHLPCSICPFLSTVALFSSNHPR